MNKYMWKCFQPNKTSFKRRNYYKKEYDKWKWNHNKYEAVEACIWQKLID